MSGDSRREKSEKTLKLDLLAFAAHPDDAELNAGGLIAKMVRLGHKVGIVDLTAGQMASRGSVALREKEANQARIKGLADEVISLTDKIKEDKEKAEQCVIKKEELDKEEAALTNSFQGEREQMQVYSLYLY